jgi:hypothetical protein
VGSSGTAGARGAATASVSASGTAAGAIVASAVSLSACTALHTTERVSGSHWDAMQLTINYQRFAHLGAAGGASAVLGATQLHAEGPAGVPPCQLRALM